MNILTTGDQTRVTEDCSFERKYVFSLLSKLAHKGPYVCLQAKSFTFNNTWGSVGTAKTILKLRTGWR
jgi:hypothetical protein